MKRHKPTTQRRKSAKKRELGKYKSGLEKDCADLLRSAKLEFKYEEEEYILIESFRYDGVYHKMTPKGKEMTDRSSKVVLPLKYTPDFVAKDDSWVIETKGYVHQRHDFPMRWKLFLRYLTEKSTHEGTKPPMVFICKNKQQVEQAIKIIKNERS